MNERAFDNFDLLIEASGDGFRSRVLDSPAGQASASFKQPFSTLELENLFLKLGQPRQNVRRIDSFETQAAKQFGSQLFRSVFGGEVYACYLSSLGMAKKAGKGLRIRLRIDAPEFLDLPWELLYNTNLNQFISLSTDTPVIRYLEMNQTDQVLTVQPPLRILVMIASPEGFPPLDIDREWNNLITALAPLVQVGLVELEKMDKPTLTALQQRLRQEPVHIFHFIGHGNFSEQTQEGKLLLEDDHGRGRPVSGQFLGTLLHDHHSLRLAILNACEGARTSPEDAFAGVAHTLIQQGLPAVIAMQFEISDGAAITFSREFYAALADSYPVDAALAEARKAIFAGGNEIEWGTPVLYMRTPQGVIFDIPRQKHAGRSDTQATSPRMKTRQAEVELLYTQGSAAFWVEDWDEACLKYQAVLELQPGHGAALLRLKEARQKKALSELYEKAKAAFTRGDHRAAIADFEQLQLDSPSYRDSKALLENARQKLRLSDLYDEARDLHAASQWQAVLRVFEQITALDPAHSDPDGLLPSAQQEVEKIKQAAELNDLYSRAVRALDDGQWVEAHSLLTRVNAMQADYLQTGRLLKRVEEELAQVKEQEKQAGEQTQRAEQVNSLYAEADSFARMMKWNMALDKMDLIHRLDPHFEDKEDIAERARNGLEQEKDIQAASTVAARKEEIAQVEEKDQRTEQINTLYAEAGTLAHIKDWRGALDRVEEIRKLDPQFEDKEGIYEKIRTGMGIEQEISRKPAPAVDNGRAAGKFLFGFSTAVVGLVISFLLLLGAYYLFAFSQYPVAHAPSKPIAIFLDAELTKPRYEALILNRTVYYVCMFDQSSVSFLLAETSTSCPTKTLGWVRANEFQRDWTIVYFPRVQP